MKRMSFSAAMRQYGLKPVLHSWIPAFAGMTVLMVVVAHPTKTAFGQSGGDYILNWSTIDGGGGQSSGGQYALTGTIGQPDAAYSSAEKYKLLGGFWPGGPLCIVQFDDFARFAEQWLYAGTGLPGDLDKDGNVDLEDMSRFADYWLCYCPYNWSLR